MKLGIIREGRIPPEKRVPFTPEQCRFITENFKGLQISVQPSSFRCYPDGEYASLGIRLQEDLDDCDILMGIKEVPPAYLIAGKTYFFFSHTIKKQPHNRKLLQEVLKKEIRLVDFENLTDSDGLRIIGFGRFAGLVGTYNGLRAYGLRHSLYTLKPAHQCINLEEMKQHISSVGFPGIKIAVTGGGRVAGGATHLLDGLGIRRLTVEEYQSVEPVDRPVYVQLNPDDYNRHKEGKPFELNHFFSHPDEYKGNFSRFLSKTDLLIGAAYWDPKAPALFELKEMQSPGQRISVIADITCDLNGSIPTTLRTSTIDEPFYDINPLTGNLEPPFSGYGNITVMAVDNLPCSLPRDASTDFGKKLIERVLPLLINGDEDHIIERATITKNGALTSKYSYLQDYVEGKE